jgi:hypothetical protein
MRRSGQKEPAMSSASAIRPAGIHASCPWRTTALLKDAPIMAVHTIPDAPALIRMP